MTRTDYIRRTLRALCGDAPARPDVYYQVVRMADEAAAVCPFDRDGNDEINDISK